MAVGTRVREWLDARPPAQEVLCALLAMGLSVIGALVAMRAWNGDPAMPVRYGGDSFLGLLNAQAMIEDGWYLDVHRVGAPFGLDFHDYAVGMDNGNFLLMKLLTLVTSWAPYVLNGLFLSTFALVSLSAYCVLRALGAGRATSVVSAVLFALVPIHWERGAGHLFLSAYWSVPLGAYLFVQLVRGEALLTRRPTGRARDPRSWLTRRTLATLALCALIASGGVYYAAFTVAFVALAGVLAAATGRRVGPLGTAATIVAAIGIVAVFNLAPTIVYQQRHGDNAVVAQRTPAESEVYSLRFAQLVLPQASHRWGWYAAQGQKWRLGSGHNGEGAQTPGTIGVLALLALLAVAAARVVRPPREGSFAADERVGALSLGVVAALFIATTGGLATLFAFYVSPQLRASNRISIFVAFFALAALAIALDRLGAPALTRARKAAFTGLLVAMLAFGFWDQTTDAYIPDYNGIEAQWDADGLYGRSVEQRLGGRGEVLQLPYHAFPESAPVGRMADYDQFRSFLHTSRIEWSYGAMKGRPEDWQEELAALPVREQVAAAAAAGFDGVEVDRFGFGDGKVEKDVAAMLGGTPIVSPDGRLAFYDARRFAARVQKAASPQVDEAVLEPLQIEWADGFSGAEPSGSRWADRRAELRIENPSGETRVARLTTMLGTSAPSLAVVEVPGTVPRFRTVQTDSDGERFTLRLWVPPGGLVVKFSTEAPPTPGPAEDTRPRFLYFVEPSVVDVALERLAQQVR